MLIIVRKSKNEHVLNSPICMSVYLRTFPRKKHKKMLTAINEMILKYEIQNSDKAFKSI